MILFVGYEAPEIAFVGWKICWEQAERGGKEGEKNYVARLAETLALFTFG